MYRWVVVFSIMFFLNKVLEPYGLKILGQLMAVAGLFVRLVGKYRASRSWLAVVGAIIAFVLFVPLPFSVKCTFEVQPREAQHVFTSVPGQLTLVAARPGQTIA
jgi:putative peptide zinc metalloprotease protein